MPLTIDNAGALVPGVILKQEGNVATIKVKVLRGFYDGKNILKPGDIVNLPIGLAHQAKDSHKVEFLPDEKPPEVKPEATKKSEILEEAKPEEAKPEELNSELRTKHKKYGG